VAAEQTADELLRAVGRRIAEIRREAGLTQAQVAEQLDVSTRAYAYIESGRENLTLRTMLTIANVLGATVPDLLVPPKSRETKRGRPPRNRA
jgi:transcriptional regulator with XRE-family HTH domain